MSLRGGRFCATKRQKRDPSPFFSSTILCCSQKSGSKRGECAVDCFTLRVRLHIPCRRLALPLAALSVAAVFLFSHTHTFLCVHLLTFARAEPTYVLVNPGNKPLYLRDVFVRSTQMHRQTDTQTHRHTQTQTQTHRHTDTDTDTHRHTHGAPFLRARVCDFFLAG